MPLESAAIRSCWGGGGFFFFFSFVLLEREVGGGGEGLNGFHLFSMHYDIMIAEIVFSVRYFFS